MLPVILGNPSNESVMRRLLNTPKHQQEYVTLQRNTPSPS